MPSRSLRSYFLWPVVVTVLGLVLSAWLGWRVTGTLGGLLNFLVLGAILAALEIALSFDNAVVNANRLSTMSEVWRRRFLTWGILIAVFGMRIVFPLAVVCTAAWIGPMEALDLAINRPDDYAHIIEEAHLSISAFGGTFLMMVALTYFIDEGKDVHWVQWLERRLADYGAIRGFETALVLLVVVGFAFVLPAGVKADFVFGALFGLLVFSAVDVVGHILDSEQGDTAKLAAQGGIGAFLYLEVLDASFSFDGVIGAFALTTNLFLIAIGLGIGAMYVRSFTIMIVEKKTLAQFRYLEHGAFYSVFFLSLALFAQSVLHVPEPVTGLLGVVLIGLALLSSQRYKKAQGGPS
ncbi:DUF475 domain-containing protein [Vannielia litorea]|uniref:DUF475 domain-containing protein n=1 Tax=Vannielia litorea TaxID=1217970 RepID=UPI001C968BAC|nr:DUF475 domain-containing protein [Vannielia litorea]MBY6047875.1 DUF475 domain-containing protein [Vannielia litorea]MBY6075289.1 DUF475 domain-containing protein [Vannielia litorea]